MSLFSKAQDAVSALSVEGRLPGFERATGWLNSEPLTADDLRGKVVLVDFWTYTCINWLRTLGYVRAWGEKYEDQGLVVVGVHTPEFPFEADKENVVEAVKALNVEFPIALDPEYAVWEAFATATGRPSTSPTRRGGSGTTSSARADTTSANGSSSGCCAMPGETASATTWSRSFPTASRPKPTGRTWDPPRPTSATSKAATSRLPAA